VHLAADDPWASYGRTVVDVLRPDEDDLRVRPAAVGEIGTWPWPSGQPVHILTAWDPGPERPGVAANRARQADLEGELRSVAVDLWAAVGVDPATGHREEGVAVRGVSEAEILVLGARYLQDAVFAWTPLEWAIVACDGGRRFLSGWSLAAPEPRT
jgi:Protein of unknown function (DUF3293)